jgi:undecaprenyl-diphosphatase
VGLAVASVSAFLAIWSLMKYLERFSSWIFVIYRFVLGALLILGVTQGWLQ